MLLQIEFVEHDYIFRVRSVKDDKLYKLQIEFTGLDEPPRMFDYLLMPDELVSNTAGLYCFSADLRSGCGRELTKLEFDSEVIALIYSYGKGILLKRLYG